MGRYAYLNSPFLDFLKNKIENKIKFLLRLGKIRVIKFKTN